MPFKAAMHEVDQLHNVFTRLRRVGSEVGSGQKR